MSCAPALQGARQRFFCASFFDTVLATALVIERTVFATLVARAFTALRVAFAAFVTFPAARLATFDAFDATGFALFFVVFFAAFLAAFLADLAAGLGVGFAAGFAATTGAFFLAAAFAGLRALRVGFDATGGAASGAVAVSADASGVTLLPASIVSFTSLIVPPVHWARARRAAGE